MPALIPSLIRGGNITSGCPASLHSRKRIPGSWRVIPIEVGHSFRHSRKMANIASEWVATFSPEQVANIIWNRRPTCPGKRIIRSLVRRSRLISGFCSSARAFARRFFRTPFCMGALALHYPSPPSGWGKTFTSKLSLMLGTRKESSGRAGGFPVAGPSKRPMRNRSNAA